MSWRPPRALVARGAADDRRGVQVKIVITTTLIAAKSTQIVRAAASPRSRRQRGASVTIGSGHAGERGLVSPARRAVDQRAERQQRQSDQASAAPRA